MKTAPVGQLTGSTEHLCWEYSDKSDTETFQYFHPPIQHAEPVLSSAVVEFPKGCLHDANRTDLKNGSAAVAQWQDWCGKTSAPIR
jgi:hypothetical protein